MVKKNNCLICGGNNLKFFTKQKGYSFYTCPNCNTLLLLPQPSLSEQNEMYEHGFEYKVDTKTEERIKERSNSIINQMIKLNPQAKSILDIGSGWGYLLKEAKKYYLKETGIEPAWHLYKHSKQNLGLNTFQTTFEEFAKKK